MKISKADRVRLAEMWDFTWPLMDVLIGGKSSIDLPEMDIASDAEATEFIKAYGFDPAEPANLKHMHAMIIEALNFIERYLMPREWSRGNQPPPEVLTCADPRKLLMWASEKPAADSRRRAWACAVLKVMHTIVHIQGVLRRSSIETAREQIMGRFHDHILRSAKGELLIGDETEHVALKKIEWKHHKRRESIILKLLHKPDNVAETIYDLIGIRIVTNKICDVMMVVKLLDKHRMITFPNCVPSRTRNTLIGTERFRHHMTMLREMVETGSISPTEFYKMMSHTLAPPVGPKRTNPHSSASYRSVQITCRQMIRTPNPVLSWLEKILDSRETAPESQSMKKTIDELQEFALNWHSVRDNRFITAFFPFEVQIMDAESYSETVSGEAAHVRYKSSQIRAARRRVLQEVLQM